MTVVFFKLRVEVETVVLSWCGSITVKFQIHGFYLLKNNLWKFAPYQLA